MAKKSKKEKEIKEEDMPTRPAFVLVRGTFEYDDNYYNQNDEGGTPLRVYLDENRAKDEARKKNRQELLGTDLSNYSWTLRDSRDTEDDVIMLVESFGGTCSKSSEDNDYEFKIESLPDDITSEQIDEILSALGIRFHTVEEIDLEMYME